MPLTVTAYRLPRGVFALALLLTQPLMGHAAPRNIVPAGLRENVSDDTLTARILGFARDHLGRQVGDGECYDLADAALHAAGARSAPDYGAVTEDADYVWGRPVALRDARPGDIVQFRDFNIATTVTTSMRLADGRTYTTQDWQTDSRDHHTAIIERNKNGMLSLLEQNVPPLGPRVQRTMIPVVSMSYGGAQAEVEGSVRVYRPEPE